VLAVAWGKMGSNEFPVEIDVQAFDRRGLVRDVSAALADDKISIRGMNTVTDKRDNIAHMRIEISITGLPQLSQVLGRIAAAPQRHQRQAKEMNLPTSVPENPTAV